MKRLFPQEAKPGGLQLLAHLFLRFRAGQVPPLLNDSSEVDGVQRNKDLADLVVLREAIEVVHSEDQRF